MAGAISDDVFFSVDQKTGNVLRRLEIHVAKREQVCIERDLFIRPMKSWKNDTDHLGSTLMRIGLNTVT